MNKQTMLLEIDSLKKRVKNLQIENKKLKYDLKISNVFKNSWKKMFIQTEFTDKDVDKIPNDFWERNHTQFKGNDFYF